ncbi:MAG: PQQ-binding-like beta-propeller repeat protein [Terracidiphilus sp.]
MRSTLHSNWATLIIVLLVLTAYSATSDPLFAATAEDYHLLARLTIGGDGFWDYLAIDTQARRLYISRWSHVMVVDADSYRIVGDIPGIQGVHGIAIAPEFGRGFITEDEANRITIFDLRTLKKTATARTGNSPDGIIYDSSSKRAFVFSKDGKVTAVNAATGEVVGSAELGGSPEFAASDGRGHIYNNLEDKNQVLQIDSRSLRILNRWSLAPGESPSGMAIDAAHQRLFVGCHNRKLVVMNSDTGKVVTTIPIGAGVDANRFDPDSKIVFSSNGDGTLTVVHEDSADAYSVIANLSTQRGARTMELDPRTHRVYLVTAQLGPQPAQPHTPPAMVPGTFELLVFGQMSGRATLLKR